MIVTIVGVLYGGFILAFVLIAHALFLAHVRGNGVRVSDKQLPELYAQCQAAAAKLGLERMPQPYHLVPLLGAAYSRAREYTCDRCGLEVVGEMDPAVRGLALLAAGGRSAMAINVEEFMEQRKETGEFWMAVHELGSSHPYLCKRVAALKEFTAPGTIKAVPRSMLAYPFAPFLGFGGGGAASAPLMVLATMGILAALAIPAFKGYMDRAK